MWMNLLVFVVIGGLGYLWVTRGFFSAMINLVCVIAAGAIAFAFWEPLSLLILEKVANKGMLNIIHQSAWGLGLALPFGASLAILRAILDKLLPSNTVLEPAADYVGGGICGLGAGIITAGMLVLSMGMLRLDTDVLGYRRIPAANTLVSRNHLVIPVDDLVAGLYGRTSTGVFAAATPLSEYYPNLADVPELLRTSDAGGKAMNVMTPQAAFITRRYRVGTDQTPLAQLTGPDAFERTNQNVTDIHGDNYPAGSRLEGFVVQFNAPAKEKGGQVLVTPAQIRLLVHGDDGNGNVEARDLFPIAAVSLASATPRRYARWRFDAPNLVVASAGGATEVLYSFEFVIPPNFQPVAMYVKGIRYDIDTQGEFREGGAKYTSYPSVAARDAAIPDGRLTGAVIQYTDEELDAIDAQNNPPEADPNQDTGNDIRTQVTMGNYAIQKGTVTGVEIDEGNHILQADARMTVSQLNTRILERSLRINQFMITRDTAIVQVDVSVGTKNDLLEARARGATDASRVQLVDEFNNRYDPVGYIAIDFPDRDLATLKFAPGDPIRSMGDLPTTSRTRPNQKLILIYRVSAPTHITSFEVGDVVVQSFRDEPLEVREQSLR